MAGFSIPSEIGQRLLNLFSILILSFRTENKNPASFEAGLLPQRIIISVTVSYASFLTLIGKLVILICGN